MSLAGAQVDLFVNRQRIIISEFPVTRAVPRALAWLPYFMISSYASKVLEARFLSCIRPGDVAYLWPAASLDIHRKLHDRGIPIVLESINTRMASAKKILDQAYIACESEPDHSITSERINEEEEKYRYASAIFAPSRAVEASLSQPMIGAKIMPTSYGADTSSSGAKRQYEEKESLNFMFCGSVCVRKGAHLLLKAWEAMPSPHRLILVGEIEPIIKKQYHRILETNRIEATGFVRDVNPYFEKADVFVFPSLEEGDPLVTYEAAVHGLPIIASPMGSGRLGNIERTMLIVDPYNPEHLKNLMLKMLSTDLRSSLGQRARTEVAAFDWKRVGAKRVAQLQEVISS
jgi:glycosyltransferase involved in cell wall biosynthesis